MTESQKKNKDLKKDVEEEVWSAISAFEQILEAMPNDRASLEALSHAYEQISDHVRAKDYMLRLGNVLINEGDVEAARQLREKIEQYAEKDPAVQELIARIEKLIHDQGKDGALAHGAEVQPEQVPGGVGERVSMNFNMADELSFAWNLLEANELTQEEYASVVQDLTEMSAEDTIVPISVLHVLEGRGFKNLEKIIAAVSKECDTPIISPSSFELQPKAVSILPMNFMVRRGAILFESLGKDGLVVVMNPYNKQLRKDVETLAGRKCHFFITIPSEFDKTLEKIAEMLAEKASSEE